MDDSELGDETLQNSDGHGWYKEQLRLFQNILVNTRNVLILPGLESIIMQETKGVFQLSSFSFYSYRTFFLSEIE